MDVTSHHLDIVPAGQTTWPTENDSNGGEETSKRGESFGKPVGKGEYLPSLSKNYKREGTVR